MLNQVTRALLVIVAIKIAVSAAYCNSTRYRNAIKVIGVKPSFEYANWLVYERPTAANVTFLQLHNERHLKYLCKYSLPRHVMEVILNEAGIEFLEEGAFSGGNYISVILSDNRLQRIETDVFTGTNIANLILTGNEISEIEEGAFNDMPQLEAIDLSYNRLRSFDGNWFRNCPKLYDVAVTHNLITEVPENATRFILGTFKANNGVLYKNLPGINLDHNEIEFIHPKAFYYGPTMFHLISFNNNKLKEVPQDLFGKVTFVWQLFLNSNLFTCVPNETIVNSLRNVRRLFMGGNSLNRECLDILRRYFELKGDLAYL